MDSAARDTKARLLIGMEKAEAPVVTTAANSVVTADLGILMLRVCVSFLKVNNTKCLFDSVEFCERVNVASKVSKE